MKNILVKTAFVLSLGIAPATVLAQTEPVQPGADAGATVKQQPAQSGAAAETPKVEGQAGAGAKVEGSTDMKAAEGATDAQGEQKVEGAAETKTEGQAGAEGGAATESQAQGEKPADANQPAQAEGEKPADQPAQAEGEKPAGDDAQQAEGEDAQGQDKSTTAAIPPEVTTEQKTEIRTVIQETRVEPVAVDSIDVDISVGVAVPRTIVLHPLPPRIITILPAYEGYRYFVLADGRIIIIEPDTYEIVYVLV